jgi:hypothetical protein
MNEDWKSKRYRYHVTLASGTEVDTNYFDTYADLERWIKSGAAGVLTPKGFVEIPLASVKSIQPLEEGQAQGQQPPEVEVQAPPPPPDAGPTMKIFTPAPTTPAPTNPTLPVQEPTQPTQDHEGTLQIPRDPEGS